MCPILLSQEDFGMIAILFQLTIQQQDNLKYTKLGFQKSSCRDPVPFCYAACRMMGQVSESICMFIKFFPGIDLRRYLKRDGSVRFFLYQKNTVVISMFYWCNQTTAMWGRESMLSQFQFSQVKTNIRE